jgi:hypothetical protein
MLAEKCFENLEFVVELRMPSQTVRNSFEFAMKMATE